MRRASRGFDVRNAAWCKVAMRTANPKLQCNQ
jgi:hypothetical protein